MSLFEIKTPDGRYIRHHHATLDAARAALQPGYEVSGEVIGAAGDGHGGFVQPIGAKSVLAALIEHDDGALLAWFETKISEEAAKTIKEANN